MATHTQKPVRRDFDPPYKAHVLKGVVPAFKSPPKQSRIIPQNDQPPVISPTAVDGSGNLQGGDPQGKLPGVRVVELPRKKNPVLKQSISINLAVAQPAGGLVVNASGNVVFYADSTNGTDRVNVQYATNQGDQSQPVRVMVPGRLRNEAHFSFLIFSWNVIAGATAVIEIYDDPDRVMDIEG